MKKNSLFERLFAGCIILAMIVVSVSSISNAFNVVELDSKHDYSYSSTAGVFSAITDIMEKSSLDEIEDEPTLISEITKEKSVVKEETIESEESIEEVESIEDGWHDKLMADVDDKLNVRAEASEEGELAGKLRRGDLATIVDIEGDWIKISSGNLEGYVLSDYCVTGDEAKTMADETCKTYAKVQTDGLRIRKEPSEDSSIVDLVSTDDHVLVDKEAEDAEGWVGVTFEGQNGFVNSDYVELETKYGEAITIEEEQAAIAAAKAAEAKKKAKEQKSAVGAGADEVTLLAALIQCEAGRGGYDGQLAVGAVVCNRARRGYGGGSISGVIYQPGQFPPATNGIMAGVLAGGVSGSCIQAAQAALGGADNTGGAVNFRSASSGYGGTVIGGNVFF